MQRLTLYMAGPLFSLAERVHNLALAQALEQAAPRIQCILPQLRAVPLLPDLKAVAQDCFAQVGLADLVIVNADGADTDSGTAVELGYARALARPTIVYRTDFRSLEVDGVNAMLRYGCDQFVHVPEVQSVAALAQELLKAIVAIRGASGLSLPV